MKKILFLLSLLVVFLPASAFGEGVADKSNVASVYLFHLYFDNGQLVADRDFQFKYDIIMESYVEPALATGFPYRGEIINFAGQVGATFKFDPRNGSETFKSGKVSVKAPYVADGQKVVFYDSQNNAVLTIPVDASSFCNDDGICNADRGEDYKTCSRDCKSANLPVPSASPAAAAAAGSSSLALGILYAIIGLILLGGLWWFFKRRGSDNGPTLPPPTPPSPGNIQ